MEDFVSLNAVGKRSDVVIDGTVTFASDAGDVAEIKGFLVQETTTTTGLDLITSPSSTGKHSIKDCTISLINSDGGDVPFGKCNRVGLTFDQHHLIRILVVISDLYRILILCVTSD